ncbi:MAG: cyclic nucleotide-binding domain-containing protein [Candidatus Gracilibacteria bacterium]|nr:cyclic nucleotide-binding domain-containing protein [Candidatus Gracilibacteria bacterium]
MLDINKLKNSGFFKEVILEKGEVLFREGDFDENIYIVLAGELSVSKYTSQTKDEAKILAYLSTNDVFGEAALNSSNKKEVNIIANRKTILLSINAKQGLNEFGLKYQEDAINLLKYIIYLSNKRLSEANYLITASYKISKEILELQDINNKNIFLLIEKIKEIITVDHIMYYENSPVMENYIILKYDTRIKGKLLNEVKELTNNKLDLLDLKVDNYEIHSQKLSIGKNNLGYLVFLKKDYKFNESDKKVLVVAATSISGLIKQKQLLDEQRDKDYMNN